MRTGVYQVHEAFSSIQGEGVLIGLPSTFIRLQGCTVGCSWCDAKRTWGPVNDTKDYEKGKILGTGKGYAALKDHLFDTDREIARGVIATMFELYGTALGSFRRRYPVSVAESFYPQQMLIQELSLQDLHPIVLPNDEVAIPQEQWQVFVDYFRPVNAQNVLGVAPRRSGQSMTTDQIVTLAEEWGNRHVVITGGEPTLWNLDDLIIELRKTIPNATIQLETSGQYDLKGEQVPDHITWSPKANLNFEAPLKLRRQVAEVKWVVDQHLPFSVVQDEWDSICELKRSAPDFVFMPEGCPPSPETIALATEYARRGPDNSQWSVGARLQYYYGVR